MTDMTIALNLEPAAKAVTTDKRGLALLRHVMDHIEQQAASVHAPAQEDHAGTWNQNDWAVFDPQNVADLPPDGSDTGNLNMFTTLRVLSPEDAHLCGTAFCFAGHTCLAVGDSFLVEFDEDEAASYRVIVSPGPVAQSDIIANRATQLLDLDDETTTVLFRAHNTLADLRAMVETIEETGELICCQSCGGWVEQCEGCC